MQFVFSAEQIEELRVICEGYFGEAFTPEEARVMAINMLALYEHLSALQRVGEASGQQEQSVQSVQ